MTAQETITRMRTVHSVDYIRGLLSGSDTALASLEFDRVPIHRMRQSNHELRTELDRQLAAEARAVAYRLIIATIREGVR